MELMSVDVIAGDLDRAEQDPGATAAAAGSFRSVHLSPGQLRSAMPWRVSSWLAPPYEVVLRAGDMEAVLPELIWSRLSYEWGCRTFLNGSVPRQAMPGLVQDRGEG